MKFIFCIERIYGFIVDQSPLDTHVKETLLTSFSNYEDLGKIATYTNVFSNDSRLFLSNENHHDKGSLINLTEKIATVDFSIKFTLDHLILKDSEVSGAYVWFTEKPITFGNFRNGPSKFKGFMGGVEFAHNKARLVFSYNHGEDYKGKEHVAIVYDKIDESKLEGVSELTIKIIHTRNNIKFEVYDGDVLLSDTFKINDPELVEMESETNHIGFTTYYEDIKPETILELKSFELYSRKEEDNYNNMDLHTEHNSHVYSKSTSTVIDATANVSHFLSYLTAVLGDAGMSSIEKLIIDVKEEIREVYNKVHDLPININIQNDENIDAIRKIDIMEDNLKHMYNNLRDIRNLLNDIRGKHHESHSFLKNTIIGFGILITVLTIVRLVCSRDNSKKKTLKSLE